MGIPHPGLPTHSSQQNPRGHPHPGHPMYSGNIPPHMQPHSALRQGNHSPFQPVGFQPVRVQPQESHQRLQEEPAPADESETSDEENPNNITNNSVVAPLVQGVAANKPVTPREGDEGEKKVQGLSVNKTETNGPMPTMPGMPYDKLSMEPKGGIPMNDIYKVTPSFYITPKPKPPQKNLKSLERKDGAKRLIVARDGMSKSRLIEEGKSPSKKSNRGRRESASSQACPIEDVKVVKKEDGDESKVKDGSRQHSRQHRDGSRHRDKDRNRDKENSRDREKRRERRRQERRSRPESKTPGGTETEL